MMHQLLLSLSARRCPPSEFIACPESSGLQLAENTDMVVNSPVMKSEWRRQVLFQVLEQQD
jgi:hypothetical protein